MKLSVRVISYKWLRATVFIIAALMLFFSSISAMAITTADSANFALRQSHSLFYKSLPYLGAVALGGVILASDKDIQRESLRSSIRGTDADKFFHTVEHFGTPGPCLTTIALQVPYGIITRNNEQLYNAAELAGGFICAQAVTNITKKAFGRKRPYESSSPYRFFKGGQSFYSGHTVTAFTYSTIMAKNYPRQDLNFIGIDRQIPIIPILMYSASTLVAIQRIYKNVHWASDTYVGALAGYGIGSFAVFAGRKIESRGFHFGYYPGPELIYSFEFN